jgi:hypothetical protein
MPGRRFPLQAVMLEAMVGERSQPTAEKLRHLCLDKGDAHPTGHAAGATCQNTPHIRRIGKARHESYQAHLIFRCDSDQG